MASVFIIHSSGVARVAERRQVVTYSAAASPAGTGHKLAQTSRGYLNVTSARRQLDSPRQAFINLIANLDLGV